MNQLNFRNIYSNRIFKNTANDIIKDTKKRFGIDITLEDVKRCCEIKNETLDPVMFSDKQSAISYMDKLQKELGLKITDNPKRDRRNYCEEHVEPSIQFFEKLSEEHWNKHIPYRLTNCIWGNENFAVVVTVEAYSRFIPRIYEDLNGIKLEDLITKKFLNSI